MKRLIALLLFISFLFYSCSKNTITSPNGSSNSTGKISLKIDKTNAPQNVATVVAYLSKVGSDTLTGILNLRSDTSADISFQNIAIGTWHLLVNAEDGNGVVVYSGQSDVQVVEGTTTSVSLSLVPTATGTGNIYIYVTWGVPQAMFTDYSNNPVFIIYQNPSNPLEVSESKIIHDNGIYKMWYLCTYNSGRGNIWYAESTDGIHWTNKTNLPVLDKSTYGSWDDYTVAPGAVIKEGNIYKMYYNGLRVPFGQSSAGLAISYDGINWQKYPNPVLTSDSNEYHIGTQSVLKVGNVYYMYYDSSPIYNYDRWAINLATSSDGINWQKYTGNPILISTLSWEGIGVTYPSVIYDNNQFVMIYENTTRDKYGIAYSSDGFHWTKNQQPVFSKEDTNQKWSQIDYPFLIKINGEYRIYYTGNNGSDLLNISFARSYNIQ
ncbi:MAG: glycoside hydrolase family protein [Ignavibacteriaceae bacterium]